MTIGYSEIDSILDEMIVEVDSFDLQTAIDKVNNGKLAGDELTVLGNRVARNLDGREELFFSATTGLYQTKLAFFANAEFIVIPDAFEIDNGILVPGHRFAPFCSPEIFPSEIEIMPKNNDEPLPIIDYNIPVEAAVNYHLLMGSEQMFDIFVAENSNNKQVMLNQRGGNIALSVFDIREFLLESDFVAGDLLVFEVKEWSEGLFSMTKRSAAERLGDKKAWIKELSDAVTAAGDKDADYLEIPEQLAEAIFRGGRKLLKNPGASLDEFIAESETVQIKYANGETILGSVTDTDCADTNSPALPEGITVSQGDVSDLNVILKECGSMITQSEIEAIILDQCFQGQVEFDILFNRCFNRDNIIFADDAQEAIFMNQLEDIWERITTRYDRKADKLKGAVRERGLDLVEKRLAWLSELRYLDIDPSELNEDILKNMAEVAVRLNGMFSLLAPDGNELSQAEADNLIDALDKIAELQEKYIEEMIDG
jgi:hypothetical protein